MRDEERGHGLFYDGSSIPEFCRRNSSKMSVRITDLRSKSLSKYDIGVLTTPTQRQNSKCH